MFLTSVLLLTKSAFVEGLLDGSVLSCGKLVTVRQDNVSAVFSLTIPVSILPAVYGFCLDREINGPAQKIC